MVVRSSTRSTTPTSTQVSSTKTAPGPFFETPALTTTFTPPPACTKGHLTMLQSAQYQVWLNEPRPVANTTFSSCYPPQFMTSFLRSASSTLVPAFSPLVCPENYFTIFSQTITSRPMYIACCPSKFGFHPPDTSTPGRPGYGGTCFSDILSTSITQYDNSSSSGVMFFSTSGQAYAHPIDGFALETSSATTTNTSRTSKTALASSTTAPAANAAASVTGTPLASAHSGNNNDNSHTGLIAGLAVGLGLGALLILAAAFFLIRSRKRKQKGTGPPDHDGMVQHPGQEWAVKDINELPTPPIKDAPPPFQNISPPSTQMRSELDDQSAPMLQQPPTYQHSYHEMSSDNLPALKNPQR